MEQRIRESFHLIWLAAIAVCTAAAVFALVFASCTKGGAVSDAGSETHHDAAQPDVILTDDDEVVIFPAATEMPDEATLPDAEATAATESTDETEIASDAEETTLPEPDETILPEPQG